MTVHEAADKWHIKERTVQRYCASGIIERCVKDEGGRWIISDDSWPPYVVRKNTASTQAQKMAHIFRALNQEKTISTVSLDCDRTRLDAYFAAMSCQKLIFKDEHPHYDDPFRNYFINHEKLAQFKKFPEWKALVNWIMAAVPLILQAAPHAVEFVNRFPG